MMLGKGFEGRGEREGGTCLVRETQGGRTISRERGIGVDK